jgi:hypothetical protein
MRGIGGMTIWNVLVGVQLSTTRNRERTTQLELSSDAEKIVLKYLSGTTLNETGSTKGLSLSDTKI